MTSITRATAVAGLLLASAALPSAAQRSDPPLPLVLGGLAEERLRLAQLRGDATTAGWLMRAPSSLGASTDTRGLRWRPLLPSAELAWNSALPFSLNDGSLWAGRGTNLRITAGAEVRYGRIVARLAPELTYSGNRGFFVEGGRDSTRRGYASPWHHGTWSADLPLRFGNQPITTIGPGQSMLGVDVGPLQVGASAEGQWWGPGIRNAIVLSDNAGGIPHLYLRSARPFETGVGDVELRWIAGVLTESLHFDRDADNDQRSLSGLVATLRPTLAPELTLGIARAVYAEANGSTAALGHAANVLTRWSGLGDSTASGEGADQILSLFARWVLPASGAEVYGEWAKLRGLRSLRDLLVAPQRDQGWTVGLQWARPLAGATFRVQAEATTLEQTPIARGAMQGFYTSRAVPQGYTQRGQPIGAAIGPGGSSQWLAFDWLSAESWHAGLFTGRIRWENDVYYSQPTSVAYFAHDVSTLIGMRGGGTLYGFDVALDVTRALRRNYLFQNTRGGYGADPTFDVGNTTLRLRIEPRARAVSIR